LRLLCSRNSSDGVSSFCFRESRNSQWMAA
jgi:hypothetical protein